MDLYWSEIGTSKFLFDPLIFLLNPVQFCLSKLWGTEVVSFEQRSPGSETDQDH